MAAFSAGIVKRKSTTKELLTLAESNGYYLSQPLEPPQETPKVHIFKPPYLNNMKAKIYQILDTCSLGYIEIEFGSYYKNFF
jgi:hypothetical protein